MPCYGFRQIKKYLPRYIYLKTLSMRIRPIKARVFKESENIVDFIIANIPKFKNGSILAVTSKIVALAEGRVVKIKDK